MNIATHYDYTEYRKSIEHLFTNPYISVKHIPIMSSDLIEGYKTHKAALDFYESLKFEVRTYDTGKITWSVTELVITYPDGSEIFIKLNYHTFISMVFSYNDNLYMITREDYQGITIVNLSTKIKSSYIPIQWMLGTGFCISYFEDFKYEDGKFIFNVEGCYWGDEFMEGTITFNNIDELDDPEYNLSYAKYDDYDTAEDETEN